MRLQSAVKQRGLTLIELLVTMVLLGFVVALMSGAFVQIAQMLRISSEHGNGFIGRWVPSRTLQDIVANLSPDPSEPNPVVGTAQRVTLSTLALPPSFSGAIKRATIEITQDSGTADTPAHSTLTLLEAAADAPLSQTKPVALGRFGGRLIFIYLDAKGREFRQWPPQGTTQPDKLPSAIGLRNEADQNKLLHLAYYEGEVTDKRSGGVGSMFGLQR